MPGLLASRSVVDDAVRAAVGVVVDPLQPERANGSAAVLGCRLGRVADLQLEVQPPEGASITRQKVVAADLRRANTLKFGSDAP